MRIWLPFVEPQHARSLNQFILHMKKKKHGEEGSIRDLFSLEGCSHEGFFK